MSTASASYLGYPPGIGTFGRDGSPGSTPPLRLVAQRVQIIMVPTMLAANTIVFRALKRLTSSPLTSCDAIGTIPAAVEKMESFLIRGFMTVIVSPSGILKRTPDGLSSRMTVRGLTVVGCQLWQPVSSVIKSTAMNCCATGARVLI